MWFGSVLAAMALSGGGCQVYRQMGTGQRIESTRKHREPSKRTREIQVEVTTGADAAISDVRFVRSSGLGGVDAYVAESLKSSWQGPPSTKTLMELTYSQARGFSEPKVLSSSPAP
jgi:hypothetical protein